MLKAIFSQSVKKEDESHKVQYDTTSPELEAVPVKEDVSQSLVILEYKHQDSPGVGHVINMKYKDATIEDGQLMKGKILFNDVWYDITNPNYVSEYTAENIEKLTVEDVQELVDKMLMKKSTFISSDYRTTIPQSINNKPINGVYRINLIACDSYLHHIGEYVDGLCTGPSVLYDKEGVIVESVIKLKGRTKIGTIKHTGIEYTDRHNNIVYTGRFENNNKNGEGTKYYSDLGLTFRGEFYHNKYKEGVIILDERDFCMESVQGKIHQKESDKYATIILPDCTIECDIEDNFDYDPYLGTHRIDTNNILFDNGCSFKGAISHTTLQPTDKQCHITTINDNFSFPEGFTKKDFQNMSVLCYKCFLMSQFKFDKLLCTYFKENKPTKEEFFKLEEDDYLKMGLTKLQYRQMVAWIEKILSELP
jgi:hypothetical protein